MKSFIYISSILFLLFSCKQENVDSDITTIFNQISHETSGINFNNKLVETDSINYFNFGYIYMGGGVSAGDINNDGLIDLYFTGNMVSNKLYLNKGNLEFEDISIKAGVQGDNRWYTGVTMVDINNDGFLDIYCSVGGKYEPKLNQLFVNNGDNTFSELSEKYGIADAGNSIQSTFFDYDLDGDLDLYVANYPPMNFRTSNKFYRFKMQNIKKNESDKLYRNDGNKFTDVTTEAGLHSFGLSNSVTVSDLNNDGWPDIYVSNDFSVPDYLYLNNKNGTFTESIKSCTKQTALFGMGVDIADYNNDGLLDILQMDMTPGDNRRSKVNMASMNPSIFWGTVNSGFGYQYMQNMLQLNNGTILNDTLPNFSNISKMAGVSTTDWSWGGQFADLDNDGWKDIFITNGTRREINNKDYFKDVNHKKNSKISFLEKSLAIPSEKIDNFVLRNNGDLTFEKVNKKWGLTYEGFSNGSIYADLDNDGDLEIVVNNIDDKAVFFENTSSIQNNYLTIRLNGRENNKFGLGTKITIEANGMSQYQELTLTRGFQSSVAPQFHFGIGQAEMIDHIKIVWPDGKVFAMNHVKSNQILNINYSDAKIKAGDIKKEASTTLFSTDRKLSNQINYSHKENYYDDFDKEVLIPHQTSMLGPNISVGDLNGDDLDDFIVAGALGQKTAVFIQTQNGFLKTNIQDLDHDSNYEDIDILIFDIENDGDNDIYIVSGGNEFEPDSPFLTDRIYINNGEGKFSKSTTALPPMYSSGSRVSATDFDKDGDLDLLICGRIVPGNYPQPANSYLLENKSTLSKPKFVDITNSHAPMLSGIGLSTDAIWSDIDGDEWIDLIIIGEWMPIVILKNNKGTFVDVTKDHGLEHSNGWWFSINQGDFDQDGDIDFIVGNNGQNFKYKATTNSTFDIFFNDFDKNNSNDIVLSYASKGKNYPLRGRECSSQQIPAIKIKYKDYESFANATLEDVYTENDLEKSLHYSVKSFASVYMENQNGEFILHDLPKLAQVSNINQILVGDYNHDSKLDALIAGNLYNTEVETPRNDASIGLLLAGNGKGEFEAIEGRKSGFYANGDVKDMEVIQIKEHKYIIVAKNNDFLQFIKIK